MTETAIPSSKSDKQPDLQGVKYVSTKEELKEFIQFPYDFYSDNPVWVPPLRIMVKELLSPKKNPFFKQGEMALFLAEHNGKPAGRIAAIYNPQYNDFNKVNHGYFGFFECIDNKNVASLLFRVAEDWLRQKKVTKVIGPVSPTYLDEIGVMIEGFESQPAFMMAYNKPYYDELIQSVGYTQAMDLLMYRVEAKSLNKERTERAEKIVRSRLPNLNIRKVNLKKFKSEVKIIHDLFNRAWAKNWGLNNVSIDEMDHLAKALKLVIDTDFAHIAEVDGKPVGFSISLPDLNDAIKHVPDGKLFPTGWMKLLYHKRKVHGIRTALMGIVPEYQRRGIDVLLIKEAVDNGLPRGFDYSEMGWLLETNKEIITVVSKIGGKQSSKYRMYEREIAY